MKTRILAALILSALSITGLAFASGPGAFPQFKDITYESTEWYADAALEMLREGIITGEDGYFNGNGVVNRAQLATILSRYDDVQNPSFRDWELYTNDYYSVLYPGDKNVVDLNGIDSGVQGIGDYSMQILFSDAKDLDAAIDEYWDHMWHSEVREDFLLNGGEAAVVNFITDKGAKSTVAFVQGDGGTFLLFDSNDKTFETFYTSFKLN